MEQLINLEVHSSQRLMLLVIHGEYFKVISELFSSSSSIKKPKNYSLYQIKFTYKKSVECNNYLKIPGLSYSWKICNAIAHLNK
jgi:hypothetical protein